MPVSPEVRDLQKRIESTGPGELTQEEANGIREAVNSIFDNAIKGQYSGDSDAAYGRWLIPETDLHFTRTELTEMIEETGRVIRFDPLGIKSEVDHSWLSDDKTLWAVRITCRELSNGAPRSVVVKRLGQPPRSFIYP